MRLIPLITLAIAWSGALHATGTWYEIRVDGLACPYCSYGVEKNLLKADGVESIDIDFVRGVVTVKALGARRFDEAELRRLIDASGFTMRGVTTRPH